MFIKKLNNHHDHDIHPGFAKMYANMYSTALVVKTSLILLV